MDDQMGTSKLNRTVSPYPIPVSPTQIILNEKPSLISLLTYCWAIKSKPTYPLKFSFLCFEFLKNWLYLKKKIQFELFGSEFNHVSFQVKSPNKKQLLLRYPSAGFEEADRGSKTNWKLQGLKANWMLTICDV